MKKGVFLFIIILNVLYINAQEISRNTPFSLLNKTQLRVKSYNIKALDFEQVLEEDAIQQDKYQQFNVARLQKQDLQFENFTSVLLRDSIRVSRITIQLSKAKKIAIKFKNISLPKGSELFIYSPNQKKEFLSYTAKDKDYSLSNTISKSIIGSKIIIEYNQRITTEIDPIIHILGFVNFYEREITQTPGFGGSTNCEVNVACSEGEHWCQEINSVVRIFIQSGKSYSYCSGSVVNNTKQDRTPYVLTAEHCGTRASEEDFKYWAFEFNYQSANCDSPDSESEIKSNRIIGCEKIAQAKRIGHSGSDFRLIKLLKSIPNEWSVNYAGWDAQDYSEVKNSGVSIHHPYGDIKKISTYSKTLTSSDSDGGTQSDEFWKTYWDETGNGYGITEGGSSGSPLFNKDGLIIGTLATGSSFCDYAKESPDYYGKMSKHWENNGPEKEKQLKPWLDPLSLGVLKLASLQTGNSIECHKQKIFTDFTIFPNPALDIITIGYQDLSVLSGSYIEIFNLQGKLVLSEETTSSITNKDVNVSHLSDGFYILKLSKANWNIQQKFVILR